MSARSTTPSYSPRGLALLRDPLLNKGIAFIEAEDRWAQRARRKQLLRLLKLRLHRLYRRLGVQCPLLA